MIDIALNGDQTDLGWVEGDLALAEDAEAVGQSVWLAFQTWSGDWFLDRREGVHYHDRVLGKAASTVRSAEIARVARGIPGLVAIDRSSFSIAPATRLIDADLEFRTEFDARTSVVRLEPAPEPALPPMPDGYYIDGELTLVPDGYWQGGSIEPVPDGYWAGGVITQVPDGYWQGGVNTGEPASAQFYGVHGGMARYDARTLSLADGDPVDIWSDSAGYLGDAFAPDVNRRPIFVGGAKPGLRFEATGRFLHFPEEFRFSIATQWTMVAVMERLVGSPYQAFFLVGQTASTVEWSVATSGNNALGMHYGGAAGSSAAGAWPNGLSVVTRRANGSRAEAYIGENLVLTRTAGSTEAEPGALPTMGGLVDGTGGISVALNAIVHDVIFYERELTTAELATVRAGLEAEWGI